MKIYIVHIDACEERVTSLTNEQIEKMYEDGNEFIDCYNSVEELADNWNADEIFYPNMSYMRIIKD